MARNEPLREIAEKAEQNMEKGREAAESYFGFLQKTMSSYPGGADLIDKMKTYTEKNISASVECVRKLSEAKDFQEFCQIQTEFMQTQMNTLPSRQSLSGEPPKNN